MLSFVKYNVGTLFLIRELKKNFSSGLMALFFISAFYLKCRCLSFGAYYHFSLTGLVNFFF